MAFFSNLNKLCGAHLVTFFDKYLPLTKRGYFELIFVKIEKEEPL